MARRSKYSQFNTMYNLHNSRSWMTENSKLKKHTKFQVRFITIIRWTIIVCVTTRLYSNGGTLNEDKYLLYLQTKVMETFATLTKITNSTINKVQKCVLFMEIVSNDTTNYSISFIPDLEDHGTPRDWICLKIRFYTI